MSNDSVLVLSSADNVKRVSVSDLARSDKAALRQSLRDGSKYVLNIGYEDCGIILGVAEYQQLVNK